MSSQTPVDGPTASTSVFLNVASQLVTKLEANRSEQAQVLAAKARGLISVFEGWVTHAPAPMDRASAIRDLVDLQRQALDLLVSGK